jgi:hypothetical protein
MQGSPSNIDHVNKAISTNPNDLIDAVIVTLNAPRQSDSPFAKPIAEPRFMADAVANVKASMETHDIRRIVIMSAFGVGDSFPQLNFLMRPILRYTNMSYQFQDHGLVDEEIRSSGLEWVLVRPAMLKGEQANPIQDLGDKGEKAGFMPSISRASVALFLINAVEKKDWVGRTPVISN